MKNKCQEDRRSFWFFRRYFRSIGNSLLNVVAVDTAFHTGWAKWQRNRYRWRYNGEAAAAAFVPRTWDEVRVLDRLARLRIGRARIACHRHRKLIIPVPTRLSVFVPNTNRNYILRLTNAYRILQTCSVIVLYKMYIFTVLFNA